ncbi:hypothetical protein BH23PLA1_BH23PLA1_10780 [soil metagenome]
MPMTMTPPDVSQARRSQPPEGIDFPVTPMLDMSFQLLAFFILTFQAPTRESRIDLYLPAAPVALPGDPKGLATPRPTRVDDLDLETDLIIQAQADEFGDLAFLSLAGAEVPSPEELEGRLRRYAQILAGEPIRVRILADDSLRYEEAARIIGAAASAGASAIRLSGPGLPGVDP